MNTKYVDKKNIFLFTNNKLFETILNSEIDI